MSRCRCPPCSVGTGCAPGGHDATRPGKRPSELRHHAAPTEELALDLVLAARDRGLVGASRLVRAAEPPQQVRADRVEDVVTVELELVDELERLRRAAHL